MTSIPGERFEHGVTQGVSYVAEGRELDIITIAGTYPPENDDQAVWARNTRSSILATAVLGQGRIETREALPDGGIDVVSQPLHTDARGADRAVVVPADTWYRWISDNPNQPLQVAAVFTPPFSPDQYQTISEKKLHNAVHAWV